MRHVTRRFRMIAALSAFLAAAACRGDEQSGLQVGDLAPQFQCLDDHGQVWNSRDHVGQRAIVVYFYPSDFAFCCTRQARCYQDCQRNLARQGVEVVGVSGDSVDAHQMFKAAHLLTFTLLADRDGSLSRQFGVPLRTGGKCMAQDSSAKAITNEDGKPVELGRQFTAARWTFLIGKDGRILHRDTAPSPIKDGREVLELIGKQGIQ